MADATDRQAHQEQAQHRERPETGRSAEGPLSDAAAARPRPGERPREIGGPQGPEPTRYGDWERKGICVDF